LRSLQRFPSSLARFLTTAFLAAAADFAFRGVVREPGLNPFSSAIGKRVFHFSNPTQLRRGPSSGCRRYLTASLDRKLCRRTTPARRGGGTVFRQPSPSLEMDKPVADSEARAISMSASGPSRQPCDGRRWSAADVTATTRGGPERLHQSTSSRRLLRQTPTNDRPADREDPIATLSVSTSPSCSQVQW
jgi:hypothetical protein